MRPTGFKPAIPESDRPQTYALELTSIWCVKYYAKGLWCSYANAAVRVSFNTSVKETTRNVTRIYRVVLLNNAFFVRDLTNFANFYWLIRSWHLPLGSFGLCCCWCCCCCIVTVSPSWTKPDKPPTGTPVKLAPHMTQHSIYIAYSSSLQIARLFSRDVHSNNSAFIAIASIQLT